MAKIIWESVEDREMRELLESLLPSDNELKEAELELTILNLLMEVELI